MLQHRLSAVAAGGLLLLAAAATAEDRAPRAAVLAQAPTVTCAGGPGCPTKPARSFRVGDIAPPGKLHRIKTPGLYGLSDPPQGHAYAILDGQLIRIDARTGQIRSVLWRVRQILD